MCMVVEQRGVLVYLTSHVPSFPQLWIWFVAFPPALSFLLPRSRLIKQRRLLLPSTFQLFSTRHFWFAAGLSGSADASPLYFTLEMRALSESCRAARRSSAADWRRSAHQRPVQRPHANNEPQPSFISPSSHSNFMHSAEPSTGRCAEKTRRRERRRERREGQTSPAARNLART